MSEDRKRPGAIVLALALWAVAFALSLALAAGTEATGSGFTRGMNRIGTFFRWQFLAFALAIITWTMARGRSELSKTMILLARVPIAIQCLLGLAGVAIVILTIVLR